MCTKFICVTSLKSTSLLACLLCAGFPELPREQGGSELNGIGSSSLKERPSGRPVQGRRISAKQKDSVCIYSESLNVLELVIVRSICLIVFDLLYTLGLCSACVNLEPSTEKLLRSCSKQFLAEGRRHTSLALSPQGRGPQGWVPLEVSPRALLFRLVHQGKATPPEAHRW